MGFHSFQLGLPAEQGSDAIAQLARVERLGQVVVGHQLQTDDLVHILIPGGEHKHGHSVARAPQMAQNVKAVDPRQHPVEHHEFWRVRLQLDQRFLATGHGSHGEPLSLQSPSNDGDDGRLVVHDQDVVHLAEITVQEQTGARPTWAHSGVFQVRSPRTCIVSSGPSGVLTVGSHERNALSIWKTIVAHGIWQRGQNIGPISKCFP